jgi:hypothetical protein
MAADKLTVRADGEFVADIYYGSRTVMEPDRTFRPADDARSLRECLIDLAGYERAATIFERVKAAAVVTIADEYRY